MNEEIDEMTTALLRSSQAFTSTSKEITMNEKINELFARFNELVADVNSQYVNMVDYQEFMANNRTALLAICAVVALMVIGMVVILSKIARLQAKVDHKTAVMYANMDFEDIRYSDTLRRIRRLETKTGLRKAKKPGKPAKAA